MAGAAGNGVGRYADALSIGQGVADFKQMIHVLTDENHVEVAVFKHAATVLHYGGGFSGIDQSVETFVLGSELVARGLVVADVRTQDDKALGGVEIGRASGRER